MNRDKPVVAAVDAANAGNSNFHVDDLLINDSLYNHGLSTPLHPMAAEFRPAASAAPPGTAAGGCSNGVGTY
jgi:hypothetical protein